ncbi:MAG: hypothetical protein IH857_08440 [Deltaproteobacteria bacterium]|nr:hypothetical protein [Deltaproteobacteria bacterium]MCZ6625327.1 hypothetical protein [Deltaproteobacteria bacterium]
MRRISLGTVILVVGAFVAGFLSHFLYQRWTVPFPKGQGYPVTFSPLPPPAPRQAEIPLVQAREVEKIRGLAGNQARVRGRVYRVGHSAKSDTYFLNFGPSHSSFTGVIFASSLELFEKKEIHPKSYEGREVELVGEIKDHPEYGLEMILEDPSQIKVLD